MKPNGTASVADAPLYQSSGSRPVSRPCTGCGRGALLLLPAAGWERGRSRRFIVRGGVPLVAKRDTRQTVIASRTGAKKKNDVWFFFCRLLYDCIASHHPFHKLGFGRAFQRV